MDHTAAFTGANTHEEAVTILGRQPGVFQQLDFTFHGEQVSPLPSRLNEPALRAVCKPLFDLRADTLPLLERQLPKAEAKLVELRLRLAELASLPQAFIFIRWFVDTARAGLSLLFVFSLRGLDGTWAEQPPLREGELSAEQQEHVRVVMPWTGNNVDAVKPELYNTAALREREAKLNDAVASLKVEIKAITLAAGAADKLMLLLSAQKEEYLVAAILMDLRRGCSTQGGSAAALQRIRLPSQAHAAGPVVPFASAAGGGRPPSDAARSTCDRIAALASQLAGHQAPVFVPLPLQWGDGAQVAAEAAAGGEEPCDWGGGGDDASGDDAGMEETAAHPPAPPPAAPLAALLASPAAPAAAAAEAAGAPEAAAAAQPPTPSPEETLPESPPAAEEQATASRKRPRDAAASAPGGAAAAVPAADKEVDAPPPTRRNKLRPAAAAAAPAAVAATGADDTIWVTKVEDFFARKTDSSESCWVCETMVQVCGVPYSKPPFVLEKAAAVNYNPRFIEPKFSTVASKLPEPRVGCQYFPRMCCIRDTPCKLELEFGKGWETLECPHAFVVPMGPERAEELGLKGTRQSSKKTKSSNRVTAAANAAARAARLARMNVRPEGPSAAALLGQAAPPAGEEADEEEEE